MRFFCEMTTNLVCKNRLNLNFLNFCNWLAQQMIVVIKFSNSLILSIQVQTKFGFRQKNLPL
ncbi:MAG: hypothetical protein JWR05_3031 [Mucilaginibacter sp.]|nr:hypothetical protein [Mucilaginibacter sp.]